MNNLNSNWGWKKREHPENHVDRSSETESKRLKSLSAAITTGWDQVAPRAILLVSDSDDDDCGEDLDSDEERSEDETSDSFDQDFVVGDTESFEEDEDDDDDDDDDDEKIARREDRCLLEDLALEELEHPEEDEEEQKTHSSNGRRRTFRLKSAQTDTSLANMMAHIYASLLLDGVGCQLEAGTMGGGNAMNRARQELDGSWLGSSSTNDTVVSFKRFLILRKKILKVADGESLEGNDTTDPSMASWLIGCHLCSHLKKMIQTKVKSQWDIGEEADPQERVQYYRENFEKSMTESLASMEDQLWSFLRKEGVLRSRNLQ